MQNRFKSILFTLLVLIGIVAFAMPASATVIIYNGTGSGGGSSGGGGELANASYSVPYTDMNKLFQGYRFSIYDGDGNKKRDQEDNKSKTIDVFVKTPFYRGTIMPCDSKGVVSVSAGQLSKKEWISGYSSSHVTPVPAAKQTRVSYSNGSGKDSDTKFETDLPSNINVATLKEWFTNKDNRFALYSLCGLQETDYQSTDSIIVEPLFCAAVGGEGVTGTPTDFAMVGINTYGADKNGGDVAYQEGTLSTIAEYTSYLFPNSLHTERDDLGIPAGTPVATSDWYITYGNQLNKGYGCNIVTLKDLLPSEYTDTINHYMWGFKNQESICTNKVKGNVLLNSTTFQQKVGSTFTLDTDRAIAPPNGFYCENDFGSSSIDDEGKWKDYDMGTSVTQKAAEMSFEYDYQPYTYNITYEMNGGENSSDNATTYTVLYPVSFYEPTREGYDFLGWYDGNGKRVYGVNNTAENSGANFEDVDDIYTKLSTRTTGDITVYARWAEISLHITQHGYTKYDTETIEGVPENSTLTQELNSLIAGGKIYSGLNTDTIASGKPICETGATTEYTFDLLRNSEVVKTDVVLPNQTATHTSNWRPKTTENYSGNTEAKLYATNGTSKVGREELGYDVIKSNLVANIQVTSPRFPENDGRRKVPSGSEILYGDCLTVTYTFENNTDSKVFARILYTEDLSGTVKESYILMDRYEVKTIQLEFHDVMPPSGKIVLHASIYMGDMWETKNASYETNEEDNEDMWTGTPKCGLTAQFVEPNSTYRRGKTIIAAYDVTNHTNYGLVKAGKGKSPEHSVVIENDQFAIYSYGGNCAIGNEVNYAKQGRRFSGNITPTLKVYDEDNTLMAILTAANDEAVHFECPVGYTSRIWFSWTVPEDFIGDSVKLVMTCDPEHTLINETFDTTAGQVCEDTVAVTDEYVVQTPDTCYSPQAPNWYVIRNYERFLEQDNNTESFFRVQDLAELKQNWKSEYEKDGCTPIDTSTWVRYRFTDNDYLYGQRFGGFLEITETCYWDDTNQTAVTPHGSNVTQTGPDYTMRSGYGFTYTGTAQYKLRRTEKHLLTGEYEQEWVYHPETNTSYLEDKVEILNTADTGWLLDGAQSAYALFPEFMYAATTSEKRDINGHNAIWYILKQGSAPRYHTGFKQPKIFNGKFQKDTVNNGEYGTFATLDRVDNRWELPINTSAGNRVHYTPIWMPDGGYVVVSCYTDMWTPAGMLTSFDYADNITIDGDMYDDYRFASWTQIRRTDEDTISEDCEYLVPDNSQADGYRHYYEDEEYPTLNHGDKLLTADYEYTYDDHGGWFVAVRDTSKQAYGVILSEINGQPVAYMQATFKDCTNMVAAPNIPDTVVDITSAFENCTSLLVAPSIPDSVTYITRAFANCTALTSLKGISKNIHYLQDAFLNCENLTGTITFNVSAMEGDSMNSQAFNGTRKHILLRDISGEPNTHLFYVAGDNWSGFGGNVYVEGYEDFVG